MFQVEVVEVYPNPAGSPWCLIRLLPDPTLTKSPQVSAEEGVIPSIILGSFSEKRHKDVSPSGSRRSGLDTEGEYGYFHYIHFYIV